MVKIMNLYIIIINIIIMLSGTSILQFEYGLTEGSLHVSKMNSQI